jgi:hypothetical protein
MTLIDANPDGLHALRGVVTHVVTLPELGLLYTSGQVAWDEGGNRCDGVRRVRSSASRPYSPPATSWRSRPWPASPWRDLADSQQRCVTDR